MIGSVHFISFIRFIQLIFANFPLTISNTSLFKYAIIMHVTVELIFDKIIKTSVIILRKQSLNRPRISTNLG